jgi:alkyl hydroperoxide reductase subunit F
MLDANIKTQLKAYLEKLQTPIELVASLDDSAAAQEMRGLLSDIAELSDKVSLRENGDAALRPSFAIGRPGEKARISFAGLPMGHEFTSLVLALLQTGGHPPKVDAEVIEQIKALPGTLRIRNLHFAVLPQLPGCRAGAQPDGRAQPRRQPHHDRRRAVPGGSRAPPDHGRADRVPERRGIRRRTHEHRGNRRQARHRRRRPRRAKLNAKDAFDVLVVGGGPAGASAAIYAARKGIRTGLLAERFGGQVMDTLAIENFISVKETDGPKLVMGLEEHVKDYDVDIMNLQRATQLIPASGDLIEITLENGAVLKSKSVILATGARWREMNVPGEKEYRGKGVPTARTATARCSRASAWR